MRVNFGIDVDLNAASAIGGLNRLGERLTALGGAPGRAAGDGLRAVGQAGNDASETLLRGFGEAESAWGRLGRTLDLPLSLGGIWAAISGIRSLREVTIGANAAIETAQMRMAGSMKNWNDSAASAMAKSKDVVKELREYAKATPFETQPLIEAAAIASQVSRTPGGVMDVVKLSSRLAAYKGTNDPTWSTQAIVSALQGNYASLQQSFGITATKEQVESLAGRTSYGRTARGRYEALKQLIEMRVGKEGPDDVVSQLAKTGAGITTTLKDQFSMPITDMATAGYDEGVKALVRLSASIEEFQDSPQFGAFSEMMSERGLKAGKLFASMLDAIGTNLSKIPGYVEQYGGLVMPFIKVAAVILGVNAAVLALRGGAGAAVLALRGLSGVLMPFLAVVLNPLIIAGLVGLTAAVWPLIKGLDVGGQTVEKRWHGLMDRVIRMDWRAIFAGPLAALRQFITGLGEGKLDFGSLIGDQKGFVADVARIARNIRTAFVQALVDVFPEIQEPLAQVNAGFERFRDTLDRVGLGAARVAVVLGGVGLLTRAFGLGNPALLAAGLALRGLASAWAIALVILANPALLIPLAGLLALLSPLTLHLGRFGPAVQGAMQKAVGAVNSVDWARLFTAPLAAVAAFFAAFTKGGTGTFSFTGWFEQAFAPGSVLAFFADLGRPIWAGLLKALDSVFPKAHGWFTRTFGDLGQVFGDTIRLAAGLIAPLLDGIMTTLGPTVKAIGAVLLPIVGFAWGAFAAAMHALAEAVNTPGMQVALKVIGGMVGIFLPLLLIGKALGPVFRIFAVLGTLGTRISTGILEILTSPLGKLGALRLMIVGMFQNLFAGLVLRFPLLGAIFAPIKAAVLGIRFLIMDMLTHPLGAVAALRAAFMTLVARVPSLIILAHAFSRIGLFLAPLAPLLGQIGAFFLGPIGAAVGIALTLASVGKLLYDHWQPFHDLVDNVGGAGKRWFASFSDGVDGLDARINAGAKNWWGSFSTGIDALDAQVNGWFDRTGSAIVRAGGDFGRGVGGWWASFSDGVDDLDARVNSGVGGMLDRAGAAITGAGRRFGAGVAGWWGGLSADVAAFGQSMVDGLSAALTGLPGVLAAMLGQMRDDLMAWVRELPSIMGEMITTLPAPIRSALDWVQQHNPLAMPENPGEAGGGAPMPDLAAPVYVPTGGGSGGGTYNVSLPLNVVNAAGMTPEQIHAAIRGAVLDLLPQALDAAQNGVRFS